MKIATFEKNGKRVNVEVNGVHAYLVIDGREFEVKEMKSHVKHGYYYVVDGTFAKAFGKSTKGNVNIVDASAKQAMIAVSKNKRKQKVEVAENLDDNYAIEVVSGVESFVNGFEANDFFKNALAKIRKNGINIEKELNREADSTNRGEYETIKTFKMTMKEFKNLLKAANDKQEKKETALNEKFEEAKRTNKPIEISRTSEIRNNNNEEDDVEIIVTYAMPDGTTKTERFHTW